MALTANRIQYRVGHGGFHATIVKPTISGSFEPLVYVYDAGASPDVDLLERAIDSFVARLVTENVVRVNYVIISHIDEDHVNRLDYLLEALKVAGIGPGILMIPWLSDACKLLALARTSRRNPSAVAVNLLKQPSQVVQYAAGLGIEEVVFVRGGADDGGGNLVEIDSALSPTGTPVHGRVIPSGPIPLPRGVVPWQMIVSQLKPPLSTLKRFELEVKKLTGLDPSNQTNHATLLQKSPKKSPKVHPNRKNVRKAMHRAAKATQLNSGSATLTNWSTLTLYSSSNSPFIRHPIPQAPNDFEMLCEHGWLHTGDLPVDSPKVWKSFKKVWKQQLGKVRVCALTAPHHGSKKTHNIALYRRFKPSVALFNLGLSSRSTRGNPKYSKWINPKPALIAVRQLKNIKVRILNNRI
ncbi:MBL fold metallo-hydrolase [Glutamicibacter sp. NPDC087344]|uniref:MBL fold metallo-hydrolase n=1 Tax=Glutamicibacter sp. NPDC087344 TaxID=3363994 RepID=UPI0038125676